MQINTRTDYSSTGITSNTLGPNPITAFGKWFKEAYMSETEPEATFLGTVSKDGWPSGRIVLLKAYGDEGFTFYTNYESRKASELDNNDKACLTLYWPNIRRSVRIIGKATKTSRSTTSAYFRTRPLISRLGAHASPQSRPIPSREYLLDRVEKISAKGGGDTGSQAKLSDDDAIGGSDTTAENNNNTTTDDICLEPPENWGGYCVCPFEMEFWAGRPGRLHDRIVYRRDSAGGEWTCERLAP